MFLLLCVCLSAIQQDKAVKLSTIFLGRVRCVTSKNWLDFGGDPGHDADTANF